MERKGVITDLDNTLLQTYRFVVGHIIATSKDLGIKAPTKLEILRILKTNPPFETIFDKLFGEKGITVLTRYRETAMDVPYVAIDGAVEAIGRLKTAGTSIVIVSNRINKISERLNQASYDASDFAIIQPETPKPSKEAYKEALEMLKNEGISKSNIFIVGDSLDDYLACPDDFVGQFYAVTTGLNSKEEFLHLGVNSSNILSSITKLPDEII